jgi:GntR family transcriptional regulator/MocR family aminotransferase
VGSRPATAIEKVDGANDRERVGGGRAQQIDMRPGIPWAAGIDPAMWRRALRKAGSSPPSGWPDPAGLPELRAEVAGYLRRARALVAAPQQVLITRGVASGLTLLAAAVVRPGDRVGLEEPGYPSARAVLTRAGAIVVPCRADAHGLVVRELPRDLRLVYTTPAHQYPLGGRLPVRRRRELIAWARETGALIVEDDYDSEFRYDVAPLPSLYGMDPGAVVFLGTTSKILTPALGVGWLVASPALVAELAGIRGDIADKTPEPGQHALLSMLRDGDLERHVRKLRLEYARRREVLVDRFGDRLLGDTAGMHVVLELPSAKAAERVRRKAEDRGVTLYGLDRYFAGPPTIHGLAIGYGAVDLPRVRKAATILRACL